MGRVDSVVMGGRLMRNSAGWGGLAYAALNGSTTTGLPMSGKLASHDVRDSILGYWVLSAYL